jgi:hypothetical protein
MALLTDNEIKIVRNYYSNKKKEFANRKTYYSDGKLWGDTYGFDLSEPYSVEEVETFEISNKLQLDPNFKKYLTEISKELFVYSYPIIFKLLGTSLFNDDNTNNCDDLYVIIGDGGCSFSDVMYVKGNKTGTIWSDDSDSMIQTHDNFKEYITEDLICKNLLGNQNENLKCDEDISKVPHSINSINLATFLLLGFSSLKYSS